MRFRLFLATAFLALLPLTVRPVRGADLAALEVAVRQVQVDKKPETAAAALAMGQTVLDQVGVDWEPATLEGRSTLLVRTTDRSLLNRTATMAKKDLAGLTLHFDPYILLKRPDTLATYDTDLHCISFAKGLSPILEGKSSTMAHEMLHARLSAETYQLGKESLMSGILRKKKLSLLDGLNPYARLLSLQEMATYAEGFGVIMARVPGASTADQESIRQQLAVEMGMTVKSLVRMAGTAAKDLLKGLPRQTTVTLDAPGLVKNAALKSYVIQNANYALHIWVKEAPADSEAFARHWLEALQTVATQVDGIVARGAEQLGSPAPVAEFGPTLEEWKAAVRQVFPK
jgi:hypothetical protein